MSVGKPHPIGARVLINPELGKHMRHPMDQVAAKAIPGVIIANQGSGSTFRQVVRWARVKTKKRKMRLKDTAHFPADLIAASEGEG